MVMHTAIYVFVVLCLQCMSLYLLGEDRWLCTLLLQQGYRVDYAAASDAFTYAPEGFNEYFNQRRRWTPSTIANILDLLQDGRNTVASNNNISWLYIIYQGGFDLMCLQENVKDDKKNFNLSKTKFQSIKVKNDEMCINSWIPASVKLEYL